MFEKSEHAEKMTDSCETEMKKGRNDEQSLYK